MLHGKQNAYKSKQVDKAQERFMFTLWIQHFDSTRCAFSLQKLQAALHAVLWLGWHGRNSNYFNTDAR